MICTPQSVAAHSLYENANPFELIEPDGVLKSRAHNIMLLTLGVSGSAIALLSLKPLKMQNSKGPFSLAIKA